MKKSFLLIIFLASTLVFSKSYYEEYFKGPSFRLYDGAVNKKIVVDSRKTLFESFFSDSLISWDKDGLYLFYENLNFQTLFIFAETAPVQFFMIPKLKANPWLEPEKLQDEQKILSQTKWDAKCHKQLNLKEDVVLALKQSRIWDMPYVVYYEKADVLKLRHLDDSYTMYSGFYRNGGDEKPFYLRDFRNGEKLMKPLNVYDDLFKILDTLPYTELKELCK